MKIIVFSLLLLQVSLQVTDCTGTAGCAVCLFDGTCKGCTATKYLKTDNTSCVDLASGNGCNQGSGGCTTAGEYCVSALADIASATCGALSGSCGAITDCVVCQEGADAKCGVCGNSKLVKSDNTACESTCSAGVDNGAGACLECAGSKPTGATCTADSGTNTVSWVCDTQGQIVNGDGSACAACSGTAPTGATCKAAADGSAAVEYICDTAGEVINGDSSACMACSKTCGNGEVCKGDKGAATVSCQKAVCQDTITECKTCSTDSGKELTECSECNADHVLLTDKTNCLKCAPVCADGEICEQDGTKAEVKCMAAPAESSGLLLSAIALISAIVLA